MGGVIYNFMGVTMWTLLGDDLSSATTVITRYLALCEHSWEYLSFKL